MLLFFIIAGEWAGTVSFAIAASPPGHRELLTPQGPQGLLSPSIQAIVATPRGELYAGSFGMGVFRSVDRGRTWEPFNAGLTDGFILCLGVDHRGLIYAGTVMGGVFRTTPSHEGWEAINRGLKRVEVKTLLMHEQEIFAGTGRGVYRWVERDKQWEVVAEGLDQSLVSSLVMVGSSTLFAGTAGQGLYWVDLRNPGESGWIRVGQDLIDPRERLSHKFIRILAVQDEQRIYVGTQDGGIFSSEDFGRSWRPWGRTLPNDSIRGIIPVEQGVLVATGRGIFKATSEDSPWIAVNGGLTQLSVQVLIRTDEGHLYVGTSAGAFRSEDGGEHWIDISQGFGTQQRPTGPYF
ncbi:MAG: hypothetical protein D6704_01915 [Nitrospirae bacterium]|nr:MAG: hypothetical protein D6704_01915 [Nitrospirota bacterium]